MKVQFRESFVKDLRAIRDKDLLARARAIVELVERASSPSDIANLKKLRAKGQYYRVRMGDYRVGLVIVHDAVTFVRFLHRKDIYRYFP